MKSPFLFVAIGSVLSISCGGSDNKKDVPVVKYGELKSTTADSTTEKSFDLTAATCSSNADTGLLTASLVVGSGAKLDVKIKGFSTTTLAYTCAQAVDNQDGDVGQKYDGCMVEFSIPDVTKGFNTYAMHRSVDTIAAFTYAKSCRLTTQYAAPKVTIGIDCANLIQTNYQSALRNPLDTSVTASVSAGTSFYCNI